MIDDERKPLELEDTPDGILDTRKHAGFDYAKAIEELRAHLSLKQIAYFMGYEGQSSVQTVLEGSVPQHDKGEMLWALYKAVFNRKPPCSPSQAAGLDDNAFLKRILAKIKRGSTL